MVGGSRLSWCLRRAYHARVDPDWAFLRSTARPDLEHGDEPVRIVDLFAGCGGLSLGVALAAHELGRAAEIPLALDLAPAAVQVFRHNFPKAKVVEGRVEEWFDGALGSALTAIERRNRRLIGPVHVLLGGPPCQGHSDLNNRTRRVDTKNALYAHMARAAHVLRPAAVVIENVPTVLHDRGRVVEVVREALQRLGYVVADRVVHLSRVGVAQRRKRHFLLALRDVALDPGDALGSLESLNGLARTLRWAIGDLQERPTVGLDAPSVMSQGNQVRVQWLMRHPEHADLPNSERPECHWGDHSYRSMYGRLSWDEPAQTVTTGFGSMGQGRYVHPSQPRTLTPHEAARLQFFPDWFDFTAGGRVSGRGAWATMIGNAVPPKLGLELGRRILPYLTD
jgi:DNA (cytosine-5)-methyltransferase 1